MLRIIAKKQIEKLITMGDCIEVIEKVFKAYSEGEIEVPLRTKISIDNYNGNILFMPALIEKQDSLGVKVVSVYPNNSTKGKQTIFSTLMLNDVETGEPLALMDAEHITALRTGAVTGVAAKYLSRLNSKIVSIFGSGTQARTQLEGVCEVRQIKKAYVFSLDVEGRKNFVNEMSKRLNIEIIEGIDEKTALSESDIIICATTSFKPVFNGDNVAKGTFISGVGSYTPIMQEVPESLITKSTIIVDAYNAALKEAGDIIIPLEKGIITRDSIKGELGEVILKKVRRNAEEEIIFFKSVGLAIQDMSVASKVYKQAIRLNLGSVVEL